MTKTKTRRFKEKVERAMTRVGRQNAIVEASSQSSSSTTSGQALTLNQLRDQVYEWAQGKGWWDDEDNRNIPSKLALVHSEVSEALEEYREGRMETYFTYKPGPNAELVNFKVDADGSKSVRPVSAGDWGQWHPVDGRDERDIMLSLGYEAKPEGFPSEIADAFIRLADLCGYLNIDIDTEVKLKMAYNETRSYRHGGKKV